jgi:hypothetical protein
MFNLGPWPLGLPDGIDLRFPPPSSAASFFAIVVVGYLSLYDLFLETFQGNCPFATVRIVTGITTWIIGNNIVAKSSSPAFVS